MKRVSVLIVSLALLVSRAAADDRHKELGITLEPPGSYESLPVQPGEEWIKLNYIHKASLTSELQGKYRPLLFVAVIPRVAGNQNNSPNVKDRWIVDTESFLTRRFQGIELEPLRPGRKRWGCEPQRFDLRIERDGINGFVHSWINAERSVVVVGMASEADYARHVHYWKRVADTMKLSEPQVEDGERGKLLRYYSQERLSHPEYRVDVRMRMVAGWKVRDTENFIVLYDTPDEELVREICARIELLRKEYLKVFPPAKTFDAVATVRICRDEKEYKTYGGPPYSAGYWNPQEDELVLYNKVKPEDPSDYSDTFIVLYHEAFHQYIHHSAGQLPPHSWFDEGTGDYFSGAIIERGLVRDIGTNPWRVDEIKRMVQFDQFVPWNDILQFDQRAYYSTAGAYAQGWSMIYFLLESRAVRYRSNWKKIVPTYFATLKRVHERELGERGKRGSSARRKLAGDRARSEALRAAFLNVDLDELQAAWIDFVKQL